MSPTQSDQLTGVDCFSPTTCSAVGENIDPSIGFGPLAQVWNGSTWSTATVPSLPSGTVQTAPVARVVPDRLGMRRRRRDHTSAGPSPPASLMSAPIARTGYRFVASDGGVFNYGAGAPFLDQWRPHLNKPIVGMAVMPAGDGYYLVASDGGHLQLRLRPVLRLDRVSAPQPPIVGMAVTTDGAGYWLVASDGGIFSYGDAPFYGSTGEPAPQQADRGHRSHPRRQGLLPRRLRRRHLQLRRTPPSWARPAP